MGKSVLWRYSKKRFKWGTIQLFVLSDGQTQKIKWPRHLQNSDIQTFNKSFIDLSDQHFWGQFFCHVHLMKYRSKIYTKKMLDLLEILIIQYDSRLKETLFRIIKSKKENYNSLSTIIKIILSKVDENLGNEQIITMIKRLADRF